VGGRRTASEGTGGVSSSSSQPGLRGGGGHGLQAAITRAAPRAAASADLLRSARYTHLLAVETRLPKGGFRLAKKGGFRDIKQGEQQQ
jgi:hypothetical protein